MSAAAMSWAPMASFRVPTLAWANAAADEQRFRRIALQVVGLALLLGVLVPWLPLPPAQRLETEPLPAPIARLLLERAATPAPAVQAAVPEPATPTPRDLAPTKPAPTPPPTTEAAPVTRQALPGAVTAEDTARRRARNTGLLALSGELAELSRAPVAAGFQQNLAPGPGVGAGQGPGVGAGLDAGTPDRALLTRSGAAGSGGINTAAYSRDTGGGGLAGRATTQVDGAGGSGQAGSTRAAGVGANASKGAGGTLHKGGGGKASRSIEDIKLVFERHKGAIYALYNRALREDPALQGKVVLELKIAPSGAVEAVRILSSELKAEDLERKLLARIRQFDFGARDVEVMVVSWPVDFLPS